MLEQGWIDGSSTFTTIVRIVIPMAAPGIIATALLAVIFAWNDFFFAVVLTYTESPTLPILVSTFTSNEGLFLAKLSALATAIIIVPIALGIYAQRHLVHGLTGGRAQIALIKKVARAGDPAFLAPNCVSAISRRE